MLPTSGTAEVLEAINRLFEFAASHETIENLPDLTNSERATAPARGELSP